MRIKYFMKKKENIGFVFIIFYQKYMFFTEFMFMF